MIKYHSSCLLPFFNSKVKDTPKKIKGVLKVKTPAVAMEPVDSDEEVV